jgi:RNA polymerase sigma factor (sigma-70 family)
VKTTKDAVEKLHPYLPKIERYCIQMAPSTWEAQDLKQEVLFRLWRAIEHNPEIQITNAFLYRIAKNAWMDMTRKLRPEVMDGFTHEQSTTPIHDIDVRSALETLAEHLTAKQVAIVLYMDVYQFTSTETAELLSMTVGGVQSQLHRARNRLQKLTVERGESLGGRMFRDTQSDVVTPELLDAFMAAFRNGDPSAIHQAYRRLTLSGVHVDHVERKPGAVYFYFRDLDGNLFMVTS